MADGDNECTAYYDAGSDITALAEAAVTGRRFVKPTDPKDGPVSGLDTTASGGRIKVSHAPAASAALGVASYDAGIGKELYVIRGKVVPVRAGEAITAGQEVEVGAAGVAMVLAAGKAVGMAIDDIANAADGPVAVYS